MSLSIEPNWQPLATGLPVEQACFSALGIRAGESWMTEAEDAVTASVHKAVFLSAYHLAEWFAWNWWRLRWEPRAQRLDWALAHKMSSIGGGYVWPNITVFSDCERVVFLAEQTRKVPTEPLTYISNAVAAISAFEFEGAIDSFIGQVRGRLQMNGIRDTNLEQVWDEVLLERADPQKAKYRQLEALLGYDPDEADSRWVEDLIADERALGRQASIELAANQKSGAAMTAALLSQIAEASGFDMNPKDAARLTNVSQLPPVSHTPAWRRGVQAARDLRAQEQLYQDKLSNIRLGELTGVSDQVLTNDRVGKGISFALDDGNTGGRVVFRSKWETGRRFALARLLGDRIADTNEDRLFPVTDAGTYRQKFQRAFAAELLCPFENLDNWLGGDYSDESIEDAAQYFNVSPLTVRTELVNNGRIDRENIVDPEAKMIAQVDAI